MGRMSSIALLLTMITTTATGKLFRFCWYSTSRSLVITPHLRKKTQHLISIHGGKLLEEPVNRVTTLKVIEKRFEGDSRAFKARGAAHDLGVF
jgi:hypothetical protein